MKLFIKPVFSLAILFALLVISSCGDDADPVSKIVGKWEVTDVTADVSMVNGGSFVEFLVTLGLSREDAQDYADDLTSADGVDFDGVVMEFKKDGTYETTDGPGKDNGTWELSSDDKTLVTDKGTAGEQSLMISKLNDTELVVIADLTQSLQADTGLPNNIVKYLVTLTFKRL